MQVITPFHRRLAELAFIQKERELTEQEYDDFDLCIKANMYYVQKLSWLYELSYFATQTEDTEWLHEICARIDETVIGKRKKGGK
ncbi:DUF7667 family protein [Halalkalibacterium halodurans]|uniref:Uncharacterized protein n=1 Tax=Halalkalibacterium halodurans TaxID=86665 RepID=A0A0M0KLY0_ALKHA|nr:hypothetical protein [Halalkalibacterium halodurans]